MKKLTLLVLLLSISLTSCIGVQSVVDNSAVKEPYTNPLVVIPFQDHFLEEFSYDLKGKMEAHFSENQKNASIMVIDQCHAASTLNANQEFEQRIEKEVLNGGRDLLLVFQPTDIIYDASTGGNTTVAYTITGIDTQTEKEVWKGKFYTNDGPFSNGMFVKRVARKVYEKLKTDAVL